MIKYLKCIVNNSTRIKLGAILFLLQHQVLSLVSGLSSISSPSNSDILEKYRVSSYSSQATDAIIASLSGGESTRSRKSLSLDHLPTQSRHRQGFSIAPRGCEIEGTHGTCMFVWECLKTDGKHLGMCMDGFMFGSCCIHDESKNMVDEVPHESQSSTSPSYSKTTSTTTNSISLRKRPTRPSKPTKPNRYYPIKSVASTTSSPSLPLKTTPEPKTTTTQRRIVFETSSTSETRTRPTRPPRPPKPVTSFVDYYPSSSPHLVEEKLDELVRGSGATTPRSIEPYSTTEPQPLTTTTTAIQTTTTTTIGTTTTTSSIAFKSPTLSLRPNFVVPPKEERNVCGMPQTKFCPTARIVNGSTSCYGQFPWLVSVRRTTFFGFSTAHRCGGALINENWVATAGHCVDDLLVAKIRVRIGELDFESSSEPEGHEELKVIQKIVHPKYNYFTFENDLALIKLERSVDFRDNIIPICLPGNDDLLIGETGIVAGWGRLSNGGQLPNVLQYVSVPIVSNNKCENMFLKAGRNEAIPDIFLCAGYDDGGRDSCQGDSGGPLVVKGKDGRFFLGGIISWGIGCAQPNLPGVCTRISKFRDWIIDRVQ